nr:5'-3' exoribonuclease 2-like [Labrus bergylta]
MAAFLSGAGAPRGPLRGSTAQMLDRLDYLSRTASTPQIYQEVKAIKLLWEEGWKQRYYKTKFDVCVTDEEFRKKVVKSYVEGLCWVLRYYYQGCASWKWYFPFHYAPFASDFKDIKGMFTDFEKDTKPFKPLEQLMGVFPAASGNFLPETWRVLMSSPDSSIIDFYPDDFAIDLNGKKYAWQGVALLPFVDERRLWAALADVYPDLTSEEKKRNSLGSDLFFLGKAHPLFDFIHELYRTESHEGTDIPAELCHGIQGTLNLDDDPILPDKAVASPIPMLRDISQCSAIGVRFKDPQFADDFVFKAVLLPGAKMPNKVLKPGDWERGNRGPWRPQLGFNSNRQQAHLDQSGFRALGHSMNRNQHGGGQYSSAPPPNSYQQGGYRQHGGHQSYQHSRQGSLLGAPPPFQQPQYPRQQQQQYGGGGGGGGGGHGWDRAQHTQQSAYQQNAVRGRGGAAPGGYQQRFDQRRDEWHDRRDNRGQQHQSFSSGRGYPPPPPSRRYDWK